MLGNLNDFFVFINFLPLCTQTNVWRLRQDPTYVPNCGTLKEFRKICCRVLGFHRLITSEHSTHTHTHTMLNAHPTIICFRFPETNFSGTNFLGTIFPGDHFSRGPFFRRPFFRGPFFRDSYYTGDKEWRVLLTIPFLIENRVLYGLKMRLQRKQKKTI